MLEDLKRQRKVSSKMSAMRLRNFHSRVLTVFFTLENVLEVSVMVQGKITYTSPLHKNKQVDANRLLPLSLSCSTRACDGAISHLQSTHIPPY